MFNKVFNFNFLALLLTEILGGSQIYTRGPYASWTPPSGEIFLPKASTSQYLIVFLISTFQLQQFPRFQGDPKFTLRGPVPLCTRRVLYYVYFQFQLSSSCIFRDIRGVPNLHLGALRPLDAPQRRNFLTQNEYFTISNCVFNFNILALVVFELLGGSQIYVRGLCAPCTPLGEKFLYPRRVLYYV